MSGVVEHDSGGPVSRKRSGPCGCQPPVTNEDVLWSHQWPSCGLGSVWRCDCGRRWIVVKAHLIGGGWRGEWRRVRPWRRAPEVSQ